MPRYFEYSVGFFSSLPLPLTVYSSQRRFLSIPLTLFLLKTDNDGYFLHCQLKVKQIACIALKSSSNQMSLSLEIYRFCISASRTVLILAECSLLGYNDVSIDTSHSNVFQVNLDCAVIHRLLATQAALDRLSVQTIQLSLKEVFSDFALGRSR